MESDHAVRIIKFLVESPGLAYCAACVAFAADVGLADAKRLLGYLDAVAQFHRREAPCAACGRWQANIGFIGSDADAPRLAEVADVLSGHTRYRAFRIDLLSFRTGDGWRPFALVKGPTGALAPEALPIVMDLTPTKI